MQATQLIQQPNHTTSNLHKSNFFQRRLGMEGSGITGQVNVLTGLNRVSRAKPWVTTSITK